MAHTPVRCIVVDDEEKAAAYIAGLVSKTPFLELAGVSSDPLEALGWVQQGLTELVFLDLTMPELHGIDFIKLAAGKCSFIVITGYDSFALQGYELDVVDFIKKPVSYERFLKAAGKAADALRSNKTGMMDFIFVREAGNRQLLQKVNHKDILYIEGKKHHSVLVLGNSTITALATLSEMEDSLPEKQFIRVSKSVIVSTGKIEMVHGNVIVIQKANIPIGLAYQEKFFKLLG